MQKKYFLKEMSTNQIFQKKDVQQVIENGLNIIEKIGSTKLESGKPIGRVAGEVVELRLKYEEKREEKSPTVPTASKMGFRI